MKLEDRASVAENKEMLAQHMRGLVERASQSGSHLECIIGAGSVLGTIWPLLSAAQEAGPTPSGITIPRCVHPNLTRGSEIICKAETKKKKSPLSISYSPPPSASSLCFSSLSTVTLP